MASTITGADVLDMVGHWLECPVNGYLGSSYGSNVPILQFSPLASRKADEVIAKLKRDVPITGELSDGAVRIYSEAELPDKLNLFITVGNVRLAAGTISGN